MTSTRPSPLSRTLALVPPVVALVAQHADGSIFLKVDVTSGVPIVGEVTETSHSGWIEILSTQFGIANPVTLSGTNGQITAGKPTRSDLTITKLLDKSSPPLFLGCAQGTKLPTVTLDMVSFDQDRKASTYYKITLSNVIVSSLSNTGNGDRPGETVTLGYEKIKTEYFMPDQNGIVPTTATTTASWSFVTNK